MAAVANAVGRWDELAMGAGDVDAELRASKPVEELHGAPVVMGCSEGLLVVVWLAIVEGWVVGGRAVVVVVVLVDTTVGSGVEVAMGKRLVVLTWEGSDFG